MLGFATTHSGMASGDGESDGAPPFDEEERRRELGELRPFKLQKLCAEQGLDESGGKQALIDRLIDQSATTQLALGLAAATCPARPALPDLPDLLHRPGS